MNALAETLPLERAYEKSREGFEGIVAYADSEEAASMSHSDLERELEKRGRELMRQVLQEHLDRRSPGEAEGPVKDRDGEERSRKRLQERALETVFGTVHVDRAGYGREGDESLHPLDGELNLPPERYSLELRRRVAEEAAKGSFEETLESVDKATGGHVPKRQVEELVQRAARDFDAFYDTRQHAPAQANHSVLVISADGKGVVMRQEDLREPTRKAAAKRKRKMKARLSKGEKTNAKRMATVASVFGLIWSGVIISTGMITNIAYSTVSSLQGTDPEMAASVWASLDAVSNGLGGGNEVLGGVWVLGVSIVALRERLFARWVNYIGVVMGVAGLVTVVPALEEVGAVFGLGLIVWFIAVGINLIKNRATLPEQPASSRLENPRAS